VLEGLGVVAEMQIELTAFVNIVSNEYHYVEYTK
jgi:hypothetical protein